MNDIKLRVATASDIPILKYWDIKQHVIDSALTSNTRAHNFYEKMGFRRIEKRMFGEDECYVYKIDRKEWQLKNE